MSERKWILLAIVVAAVGAVVAAELDERALGPHVAQFDDTNPSPGCCPGTTHMDDMNGMTASYAADAAASSSGHSCCTEPSEAALASGSSGGCPFSKQASAASSDSSGDSRYSSGIEASLVSEELVGCCSESTACPEADSCLAGDCCALGEKTEAKLASQKNCGAECDDSCDGRYDESGKACPAAERTKAEDVALASE